MRSPLRFGLLAVAVLGIGAWFYHASYVPPDCSSEATLDLVKKILTKQFKLPSDIHIVNIRTVSGGLFARRFECDATVTGDLSGLTFLGVAPNGVHYTSEITEDTRRHYVTARVVPGI